MLRAISGVATPPMLAYWLQLRDEKKGASTINGAYLHLLLNHLPVIGTIFGLLLLLFALLRKSEEVKRVALGVFIFAALAAVPTYLTGEPAEKVAEHLPSVTEALIESHEEAALFALISIGVTGLVSLVGLFLARRAEKLPQWLIVALLALALLSSGLLGWTANLGGQFGIPKFARMPRLPRLPKRLMPRQSRKEK